MKTKVIVIGAGFTGLAAAYDLARQGLEVEVFEADNDVGGLAGTFEISPGCRIEKFYHHWFTSDLAILGLIKELGLDPQLRYIASKTGLYYANSTYRLASPFDLLRFKAIPLLDRVRTGLMAIYARSIRNWRALEEISAESWIEDIGGRPAYEVIWKPLLQGKFGSEAANVSAVWIWNKLKLRGSSRDAKGTEQLAYLQGGFGAVTAALQSALLRHGATLHLGSSVDEILTHQGRVTGVRTPQGRHEADIVLATVPLPTFLKLTPELPPSFCEPASRIRFLGNICLLLRLRRSLSDTYWLNVADPSFPFVGVIEHTNFEGPENYAGEHLVYLSKYLPTSDALFGMSDKELLQFALPHLQRMFPHFSADWVIAAHVWRAPYSQPIPTLQYSTLIPPLKTPISGLWLATMAQIYPQDRGTNYAVIQGRAVAKEIVASLR